MLRNDDHGDKKLAAVGDDPKRERHDPVARIVGVIGIVIALFALAATSYQIWTIRDNAERQLRAYVLLTQATITIDGSNNISAGFVLKNFGQSPAQNVRYWACVAVRDFITRDNALIDPTDLQEWRGDVAELSTSYVAQQDVLPVPQVFLLRGQKTDVRDRYG